jgi:hypothetical protein
MAPVPYITEAVAKEAAELAAFEVDRAVFVDGADPLEVAFLEQAAEAAHFRWKAIQSQQPDRRPFVGRARG